jgi:hypothetical protein
MVKKDWMKTDNGNYIPNLKKWKQIKPATMTFMFTSSGLREEYIPIQYPIVQRKQCIYADLHEDGKIKHCYVEVEWKPKILDKCPYCKRYDVFRGCGSITIYKNKEKTSALFSFGHIFGSIILGTHIKFRSENCDRAFTINIPYDGNIRLLYVKEGKEWKKLDEPCDLEVWTTK